MAWGQRKGRSNSLSTGGKGRRGRKGSLLEGLESRRLLAGAPLDTPPVLTLPGGTLSTLEDTPIALSGVSVMDVDADPDPILVALSVDRGALTLTAGLAGGLGAGAMAGNGTGGVILTGTQGQINLTLASLSYLGNLNYNGADLLSIHADDLGHNGTGGPLTDDQSVPIGITAVNDAPSFSPGLNQSVPFNAGAQALAWATNISAGPADEAGQTLHFNVVSNDNPTLFSVPPSVDATGHLTYTPSPTASGVAQVVLNLQDSGGIDNLGRDTSANVTLTITVADRPAQVFVNPAWIITTDVGPAGLSAGDTVGDGGTHTGLTYLVNAFSTLQTGIDGVRAGGEVVLLPGTYSGNIGINKAVKLTALSGAITTGLTIDLNSGADATGSTGITAAAVNVHNGARVADGALLANAGATVNVDAGTYGDDVTIGKSIKLLAVGGAASVHSVTLNSGASLVSGSSGVTSTSVRVNSGAKLADGITLASTTAQTTINATAASYAETVTIAKNIAFIGSATVTGFILNAGSSIAAPSTVTSTAITVNNGAKLQDAMTLASGISQTTLTLGAGATSFAETLTISRNIKFTGVTATVSAIVLAAGETVAGTNLTSSNITVTPFVKIQNAMSLASSSTTTTVNVQPGNYAETVTVSRSIKFISSGVATVSAFSLAAGESIDPLSSGVTSTSFTVASTAKVQDAMTLASTSARTFITMVGSIYNETLTISTDVQFVTIATTTAIVLNPGSHVNSSGFMTSSDITVNSGAKLADALAVASATAGVQSVITVASGNYPESVTVSGNVRFASGGATVQSITLTTGAVIDPASSGVTSPQILVIGGAKVQDALRLAATGSIAAPTQVTLGPGGYAEDLQVPAKFLQFLTSGGLATLTTITLLSGASIDAGSSGVTSTSVTVNIGARVQDGVLLVSGGSNIVKLQSGAYPDSITIAKPVQLKTVSGVATVASITLAAGSVMTGSASVSSTDIHVTGGTVTDALLLSAPSNLTTTTITLNAGNYNESPTIAGKRIKFATPGGAANITGVSGVTLDTGEIIDPASANVFAGLITIKQINGTVKVQDGIALAAAGGTVKLTAGAYAENVAIARAMKFATVSGVATLSGITLNSGASITGSANVTSANITVNGGLVGDAMALAATGTLASPTVVTLTAASYAESVTIPAKFLRLISVGGSSINALNLVNGASIDSASSGVSSPSINLSSGVKMQYAMLLASPAVQTSVFAGSSSYAETVTISTSIKLFGVASVTAFVLNSGAVIDPSFVGVTSLNVTVNNGASAQGGVLLATPGGILTLQSGGAFAGQDIAVAKLLKLVSAGAALHGITLNSGAIIDPTSSGVTSQLVQVNNGAKLVDGVGLAASGATVSVGAGVFSGNFEIDKSLTMNGAQVGVDGSRTGGNAETVVSGTVTIVNSATDVTIDGFDFDKNAHGTLLWSIVKGLTTIRDDIFYAAYAAGSSGPTVRLSSGAAADISHNAIYTAQISPIAVSFAAMTGSVSIANNQIVGEVDLAGGTDLGSATGADVSVTGNSIQSFAGDDISLVLGSVNNVNISGNQLGNTVLMSGVHIDGQFVKVAGTIAVSQNVLDGIFTGISLSNLAGASVSDNRFMNNQTGLALSNVSELSVALNTFAGNLDSIDITGQGTHDVAIANNFIQGNPDFTDIAGFGIHIENAALATPTLHITQNSITDNFIGLQNDDTDVIDASQNWWGSASGPAAVDNPSAGPKGDPIIGNVTYAPWQTDGADTSAADGFQPSGVTYAPVTNSEREGYTTIQAALDGTDAGDTIIIAAGSYAENIVLAKSVTLLTAGGPVSVASVTLASGAVLGAGSDGVTSPLIYVNNGARLQDGVSLAASGSVVTAAAGTFTGDVVIDKSLTINGNKAGIDARTRTGLAADETRLAGSLTIAGTATNAIIDGLTIDSGKPDLVVVSHADGAFTFRNNIVNADHAPALDYAGPAISIDNGTDAALSRNKIVAHYDTAAGNLAIGFDPQNGFGHVSHTVSIGDCNIAGTITLNGLDGVDISLTANTVHDASADGVMLTNAAVHSANIADNTFSGNFLAGVHLGGTLAGVTIHNNYILTNAADGIRIDADASALAPISRNFISGNGVGLRDNSLAAVDASANYWGTQNGPTTPINSWTGAPKGDVVIGANILVAPWYTDGADTDPAIDGFQPGPLDSVAPDVSIPDLTDASDTGFLNDDNITKNNAPTFTGIASPGSFVALFDGGTLIGSIDADAEGNWTIISLQLLDGVHAIVARATDQAGNSTMSATLAITIDTAPPIPSAGGTRTINENESITLNGTFETTPGDSPLVRFWHFVSSTNSQTVPDASGDAISFQALDNGVFIFRYDVTDAAGNIASDFATVNVANVSPANAIASVSVTPIDENDAVILSGGFTDPGTLDAHTITIDWGDGSALQLLNLAAGVTSIPATSHTYRDNLPADAAYAITLTITDKDNANTSISTSVVVKDVAPAVTFSGLPDDSPAPGTAIHLTAAATDPGTLDTLTYTWVITKTINDITTPFATQSTTATLSRTDGFTFTPDESATYSVTLTVIDKDGVSATTSASILIASIEPTIALTGTRANSANPLANVAEMSPFTLTLAPVIDPGASSIEYHIHWGDSTADTVLSESDLNLLGRQRTHIYTDGPAASDTAAPTYQISVDILDNRGILYHPDAGTLGVVVFDIPPTANFSGSASVNEGSAGTVLFFNASDLSPQDQAAGFTYSYDFNNDGIFELNNVASPSATVPAGFLADGPSNRTIAARIFDKDGFFTQYTRTIHITNVAPLVNAGGAATIGQNAVFNRTGVFTDPGADTWTATVDYGDGAAPQPLSLSTNKTFALAHTYNTPGTYTVTVQVIDKDLAAGTNSFQLTVIPTTLQVTTFTPTPSGVDITFNRSIDATLLNLYDVNAAVLPDLTLTGALSGPIHGSAIYDAATNTLHFIKTGSPLSPDIYTVTLASRSDGIVDLDGRALDGDANNIDGGDYLRTFTIDPSSALTVSLPDFARGPGQHVDVAGNGTATSTDLPISISDASEIQSVDFDLRYDPVLLNITDVLLAPDIPAGSWAVNFNSATPGVLHVSLFGNADLPAGPLELVRIVADVPADAPYKASESLTFNNLRVNEGRLPAVADTAVHKVAYFGDASGDGTVGSFDANRIARVAVALDGTFAGATPAATAYPLTDPLIVGDVTGDGTLSGLDAAFVARKFVNPGAVPQIPAIPIAPPQAVAAVDPTLSLPLNQIGQPGALIHAPLTISDTTNFFAADLALSYSADILNLTGANIVLSDYLATHGWAIEKFITTTGQLKLGLYSTTAALPPGGPAELLDLAFRINPAAANAQSSDITIITAPASRLNEGQLALSASNGSIVVDTIRPTITSSQFEYDTAPQTITLDFSEDVSASLSRADFTLVNLTTNTTIPASNLTLSIQGNRATLSFHDLPGSRLPDGQYRLTVNSAGVTDAANNSLDGDGAGGDHTLAFTILSGDADHDGTVGFADLVALAQHYGQSTPDIHWSAGDFNLDGIVDFADLVTLAQHYGVTFAPAPAATPLTAAAVVPLPAPIQAAAPAVLPSSNIVEKPRSSKTLTPAIWDWTRPASGPTKREKEKTSNPAPPKVTPPQLAQVKARANNPHAFAFSPTVRALTPYAHWTGDIIQTKKKRTNDRLFQ